MGKKEKKTKNVMVRLGEERRRQLDEMAEVVEIPAALLAHNAVSALLRYFAKHRRIPSSPFQMIVVPDNHGINSAPTGGGALSAEQLAEEKLIAQHALERAAHSKTPTPPGVKPIAKGSADSAP